MTQRVVLVALLLLLCVYGLVLLPWVNALAPSSPFRFVPLSSPPTDPFGYAKERVSATPVLVKEDQAFRTFRLTYASPVMTHPRNDIVEAQFFLPRTVLRPPLVIFLPTFSKSEWITDSFARYFAARGIAALSLRSKTKFLDGERGLVFAKHVL